MLRDRLEARPCAWQHRSGRLHWLSVCCDFVDLTVQLWPVYETDMPGSQPQGTGVARWSGWIEMGRQGQCSTCARGFLDRSCTKGGEAG